MLTRAASYLHRLGRIPNHITLPVFAWSNLTCFECGRMCPCVLALVRCCRVWRARGVHCSRGPAAAASVVVAALFRTRRRIMCYVRRNNMIYYDIGATLLITMFHLWCGQLEVSKRIGQLRYWYRQNKGRYRPVLLFKLCQKKRWWKLDHFDVYAFYL